MLGQVGTDSVNTTFVNDDNVLMSDMPWFVSAVGLEVHYPTVA